MAHRMRAAIRAVLSCSFVALVLVACNTTQALKIPEAEKLVEADSTALDIGEGRATFALTKIIRHMDRGETIIAFPATPATSGSYCNYSYKGGDNTVTWSGGKQYLGNWSTSMGEIFHEALSARGFNVVGDPTDIFAEEIGTPAEYLIGARIIGMKGNFCHEHHWWDGRPLYKFSGEMYVNVEWSVLNTLTGKVVLKEAMPGWAREETPRSDGIAASFENAFADSADRLSGSAVLLSIARGEPKIVKVEEGGGAPEFLVINGERPESFDFGRMAKNVVTVRVGGGHGTGFFVGTEGHVLTVAHVVGESARVQVKTLSGIELVADVVVKNDTRDVALLKTSITFPTPPYVDTNLPRVATEVFSVGSPLSEKLDATVTKGIVSALRTDEHTGLNFIQSDVAISPGNSGGPLFDSKGKIIGISVQKFSNPKADGLGLFIPIGSALEALKVTMR